jgi:hypothetical protein
MARKTRPAILALFCGVAVLGLGRAVSADEVRQPVPGADKLKLADSTIRDIFKDEFKKTTAQEQLALAAKLLTQAAGTKDDPAALYQLLQIAVEIAAKNGDVSQTLNAANMIVADFQVDALAVKTKALNAAARNVTAQPQFLELARGFLALADHAAAANDFAAALSACSSAQLHARSGKDLALYASLGGKLQALNTARRIYETVKPSFEKLAANPADAEANFAVGKYLVLWKTDWEHGLAALAKSAIAKWKEAAQADLANPQEAPGQMVVADDWMALADGLSKAEGDMLKARARLWYEKALPNLTGLDKTKVEKRLQELQASGISGGAAAGPGTISEATRKLLPTDDDLNQLALAKKNGENSVYERERAMRQRLKDDIALCSSADFQARKDAVGKLLGALGLSGEMEQGCMDEVYLTGSRNAQEFVERVRIAMTKRSFRSILHKYITSNSATYPSAKEKAAFCDWLKTQGLTYPEIDEYKKDLPSAATSTPVPTGVTEATKKLLPTQEELKQMEVHTKNGDTLARMNIYSAVVDRLMTDIGSCSAADYVLRREALAKMDRVSKISESHMGLEEAYVAGSRNAQDFVERLKTARPPKREFRTILRSYVTGHPAAYPSIKERIVFCDWLKAQGLTSPEIDEYKKDLQSGK